MIRISGGEEFRFVVPGKAESFRSRSAAKYKWAVRRKARSVIRRQFDDLVELRVDYFHAGTRRMDVDNVAKCIMDALNGIAYNDDRQASLAHARAYDLRLPFHLRGEPVDLIKPLQVHDEYVVVRVRAHYR